MELGSAWMNCIIITTIVIIKITNFHYIHDLKASNTTKETDYYSWINAHEAFIQNNCKK